MCQCLNSHALLNNILAVVRKLRHAKNRLFRHPSYVTLSVLEIFIICIKCHKVLTPQKLDVIYEPPLNPTRL